MSIRPYKESDFKRLAEIYILSKADEFLGEEFKFNIVPLAEDEQMLQLFKESNIYVFEQGIILGFVGQRDNYISWLFVHPDHRYKNIGSCLVSWLLSTLNGTITLTVAKSNVAAIKLYTKLGFKVAKEFNGNYQGNPIIVNIMERTLKNG